MTAIKFTLKRTVFLEAAAPGMGKVSELKAQVDNFELKRQGAQLICRGEMEIIIDYLAFKEQPPNARRMGNSLFSEEALPQLSQLWQTIINIPFELNSDYGGDDQLKAELIIEDFRWFMISPRAIETEISLSLKPLSAAPAQGMISCQKQSMRKELSGWGQDDMEQNINLFWKGEQKMKNYRKNNLNSKPWQSVSIEQQEAEACDSTDTINAELAAGLEELAAGLEQKRLGEAELLAGLLELQKGLEDGGLIDAATLLGLAELVSGLEQKRLGEAELLAGLKDLEAGLKTDCKPGEMENEQPEEEENPQPQPEPLPEPEQLPEPEPQSDQGIDSEYEAGLAEVTRGQAEYEAGLAEVARGQAEYEAGLAEEAKGQAEYEAGLAEAARGQAEYEAGLAEAAKGQAEYEAGLEELARGRAEYEAGLEELARGNAEYEAGLEEIARGRAEYEAGLAQMNKGYQGQSSAPRIVIKGSNEQKELGTLPKPIGKKLAGLPNLAARGKGSQI